MSSIAKKVAAETEEFIREYISYDPLTGILTARKARHKIKEGQRLCRPKSGEGYLAVSVGKQQRLRAHRVAWFLTHGTWPLICDHWNRVRDDNRLCNLRDTDAKGNACNSPQKDQGLKNPYRFIYWDNYSQRWCSVIGKAHRVNGHAGKRSFRVSKYGYEEAKRLAQEVC